MISESLIGCSVMDISSFYHRILGTYTHKHTNGTLFLTSSQHHNFKHINSHFYTNTCVSWGFCKQIGDQFHTYISSVQLCSKHKEVIEEQWRLHSVVERRREQSLMVESEMQDPQTELQARNYSSTDGRLVSWSGEQMFFFQRTKSNCDRKLWPYLNRKMEFG